MIDRCPGVLRWHQAADGGLVRVRLPGGMIEADGLRAVAAAAALGNGIVELTSRAGLQIRGLAAGDGDDVATRLQDGGLLPAPAHDRARNILAHPLGGRAPGALAYTDAVIEALDTALCGEEDLAALPGRFLFAVDDGARTLAPLAADIELVAERDGFRLRLAGTPTVAIAPPERAVQAAIAAARAFLRASRGVWRVRDIPGGGRGLAERLGLLAMAPARRARAVAAGPAGRVPGVARQRDARAAVTALPPLARLDPDQLRALAALAPGMRVSPWRTVSFVDVEDPEALAGALRAQGLVVEAGSGWTGLSSCAGLGACARARVDVRAAAARRSRVRGERSPVEHWSACERRCGEPPAAGVTVVADAGGLTVTRGAGGAQTLASVGEAIDLLGAP